MTKFASSYHRRISFSEKSRQFVQVAYKILELVELLRIHSHMDIRYVGMQV